MLIRKLRSAWQLIRVRDLALARGPCGACGCPLLIRLSRSEMGVRCLGCGASAVSLSIIDVIRDAHPALRQASVYEMSSSGPLVRFLESQCATLITSEFLDGVPGGQVRAGIRCEDVQRLSFADAIFDLCTSTEVFEHVDDDFAGFAEVFRVLKPGGQMILTVPMHDAETTVARIAMIDGQRVPILPPTYHADRRNGPTILVCRDYGRDIVQRIASVGFVDVRVVAPRQPLLGYARPVIVARKPI